MLKTTRIWVVGLIALFLVVGLSGLVTAKESGTKGHKDSKAKQLKKKQAKEECRILGCEVSSCFHDWGRFKLNLTPEQKKVLAWLKDTIDKTTLGINWCTRQAAALRLKKLEKDKGASEEGLVAARAEIKRIAEGIKAARQEFDERFREEILTDEQRQKQDEWKIAQADHKDLCQAKHKKKCPFHKNKYRRKPPTGEGKKQFFLDEAHRTHGFFYCRDNCWRQKRVVNK